MKITNYRPQNSEKVIALFDIEDLEYAFENSIYSGMVFRNWELRRSAKGGLYVTSKYCTVDKVNKVFQNYIELPKEMAKQFKAKVADLLKEHCPILQEAGEPSF